MKNLLVALCVAGLSTATHAAEVEGGSGMMVGAPPTEDRQVTLANWRVPPYNVWAFQHVEAILPTTTVDRGSGPVSTLDTEPADLGTFEFDDYSGKSAT